MTLPGQWGTSFACLGGNVFQPLRLPSLIHLSAVLAQPIDAQNRRQHPLRCSATILLLWPAFVDVVTLVCDGINLARYP